MKSKEKDTGKKRSYGFLFTIIINIAIVAYLIIKEVTNDAQDLKKISFLDIKWMYIGVGILCLGVAILMDFLKYKKMIMTCEGKSDSASAFQCAMLGKYYDNITPLGAGGQPFQMIYLHKRKMKDGTCTALPIAGFLTQQLAFVIIAAIVFIANGQVIEKIVLIRVAAYIGLFMYAILPIVIIFFALFPKTMRVIINGLMRFLEKLHIVKDSAGSAERVNAKIEQYVTSLRAMSKRPFFIIKLLFFSIIYQVAIMSIPYFMLRAFSSINVDSWWMIFSMTIYIYASITIVPTPGNSGAAEGSFYIVFSSLKGGFLFWAMIVWRLLVYYSWIILGLIIVTRDAIKVQKKMKKEKKVISNTGPLKIALFADRYYPSMDGVVRTVDAYARAFEKSGHSCTVVCPNAGKKYKDEKKYKIIRIPSIRMFGPGFPLSLNIMRRKDKKMFVAENFDVLHVHSPFFIGHYALRLGKKLGIPVVATFHSKYYDDVYNITHSRFLAKIVVNYIVDFYCKVDSAWACSEGAAQTLRSYGYNGDINVMENGVEPMPPGDAEVMMNEARRRFNIPSDRRILLFVGQQIWHKNLKLVLDTTKKLSLSCPDVLTVITGEGYDSSDIKKYASHLDMEDNVMFLGEVDNKRLLYGLYLLSDLFFFPSLYDTSGLVIREAALAGVPSLLVKGSNAAYVIDDDVNGFVAENDVDAMTEKIKEIFSLEDLKAIGQNAKNTIPITWDVIANRVIDEYRKEFGEKEMPQTQEE